MRCAVQHPGPSVRQAHGTMYRSTSMPTSGRSLADVHASLCAERMSVCAENASEAIIVLLVDLHWLCSRFSYAGRHDPCNACRHDLLSLDARLIGAARPHVGSASN